MNVHSIKKKKDIIAVTEYNKNERTINKLWKKIEFPVEQETGRDQQGTGSPRGSANRLDFPGGYRFTSTENRRIAVR